MKHLSSSSLLAIELVSIIVNLYVGNMMTRLRLCKGMLELILRRADFKKEKLKNHFLVLSPEIFDRTGRLPAFA